jgi:hypothetical protein
VNCSVGDYCRHWPCKFGSGTYAFFLYVHFELLPRMAPRLWHLQNLGCEEDLRYKGDTFWFFNTLQVSVCKIYTTLWYLIEIRSCQQITANYHLKSQYFQTNGQIERTFDVSSDMCDCLVRRMKERNWTHFLASRWGQVKILCPIKVDATWRCQYVNFSRFGDMIELVKIRLTQVWNFILHPLI